MIVADTSGLLALFNRQEPTHASVADLVSKTDGRLVVSPFVIAELDYLVGTRLGAPAAVTVVRELASGAYELAHLDRTDLDDTASIQERYVDLDLGVTDASLVVLAHRFRTRRLLTLDHRHFSTVRPVTGGRFTLLP